MFYPQKFNEGLQMQLGNAALLKVAGEISNEEFDSYCEQMVKEAAWYNTALNFAKKQWGNIKNVAGDARNIYRATNELGMLPGLKMGISNFAKMHPHTIGAMAMAPVAYTAGRLMSPSVPQPQPMSQPQFYPQTMQ